MKHWHAVLCAAAAMAGPAVAAATECGAKLQGPARQVLVSGDVQLVFAPRPWPIIVGRHFAVELAVCAPAAAPRLLRVDAEMPAHRHGMNYRSSIKALAGGNYLAEGLMFHMPGQWRLIFELGDGAGAKRLTHELEVD